MHGLAAPALAPTLALISAPSYLTLAVIGALAVIVHEARGLLQRLLAAQRTAAATTRLPGAGMSCDAIGRERSPAVPAVAPGASGASGQLVQSTAAQASVAAVAPPRAPRRDRASAATPGHRARDRQLALACLVVAGLAAAWLMRGSPGRTPFKSVRTKESKQHRRSETLTFFFPNHV